MLILILMILQRPAGCGADAYSKNFGESNIQMYKYM